MRDYNGPYRIVSFSGRVHSTHPSLDIPINDRDWENLVDRFPEKWSSPYWLETISYQEQMERYDALCVFDSLDRPIERYRIRRIWIGRRFWPRYDYNHETDFRNGPLRRVASKSRRRYGFHRQTGPVVMQQVRDQAAADVDGIRIRAKRRRLDPAIGVWCDEDYRGRRGRTWKLHRKTQWR